MGELSIRRNRAFSVPQYTPPTKAEKAASAASSSKTSGTGLTVSEALSKLMGQVSQTENSARGSRRILQAGESTLAAVQDHMTRIKELAREAAGSGGADRAALQAELDSLRAEIERILASGEGSLFLDEDMGVDEGMDALLKVILDDLASGTEETGRVPQWFVQGIMDGSMSPEELLAGLGLDKTATGAEILAAIANGTLDNSAAARLAVLYLGAVISGAGPDATLDQMLEGLRHLLNRVEGGASLDEAVKELTGGAFSSLLDFQAQFTGGTAPGLQDFLTNLLLAEGGAQALPVPGESLLTLLAGMDGTSLDLLMELFASLPLPEGEGAQAAAGSVTPELAGNAPEGAAPAQPPVTVLQMGDIQVMGRDLSGVSFQAETGQLTVGGTANVMLLGTGQEVKSILLTGSGEVTLQNVRASLLTANAPGASIVTAGQNVLGELRLGDGTALTLGGGGRLVLAALAGNGTARLTGGSVVVPGKEEGSLGTVSLPVLLEGPASLAAQASQVTLPGGKEAEPFDIIWKTLLPGWTSISSMELDGKQVKMGLHYPDAARLWMSKGDAGHPLHSFIIRGRDKMGRTRTRYAYLLWNQYRRAFQEAEMYPNPFTVRGGEAGKDWVYEEGPQTLYILSDQVTGLSGGTGMDAENLPFSGRIVLADGIGRTELSLGGVSCRVSYGRAFDLGRENDVTLILEGGTQNLFESGAGFAGISLGNGTSLSIDCASEPNSRTPDGALTASGGDGAAGIGRDCESGQDQSGSIVIRGGVITASGSGGGAGIGAGRSGAIGSITIRGGTVSTQALQHAAAIGAGVQGPCGDILITGTARIVRAAGGNPGVDIGACLFGTCGRVTVSGGASVGDAKLWTNMGIPLKIGGDTVMLPQFRLSSRVLHLEGMDVTTRESAKAAERTAIADQRWIGQIQAVYGALHSQLEQGMRGFQSAWQYISATEGVTRDSDEAIALLQDMKRSIQIRAAQVVSAHSKQGATDARQLLW